jgi:hypothetical protein
MEMVVQEGSSRFGDEKDPFGTKNLEIILRRKGHN